MSQSDSQPQDVAATLPETAPLVRLTAGVGSAGQKTWNVRRPVTLIGSRRPAHIILHDRDIANAHCVIVNTGADVLLKDLHTDTGTLCNNQRAGGIVVLKDGDIIGIGATKLQIAIRVPEDKAEDSACGLAFVEPGKFPSPVNVRLDHSETQWQIEDAIALIGRHPNATIHLDQEDVSTRHAVLVRFLDRAAIFDVGSRHGILADGEKCAFVPLRRVERVTVGPCVLTFTLTGANASKDDAKSAERRDDEKPGEATGNADDSRAPSEPEPSGAIVEALKAGTKNTGGSKSYDDQSPAEALADIESELGTLQRHIADSWDRLNAWQSRLLEDATKLTNKETDLVARESEIDAKDAALRGQLHDVTRYHEQITARERELAAQLARIQTRQEELSTRESTFDTKEADLAKRSEELKRREHVLAQRWTRLMAATCSHCGNPVNVRAPGSSDGSS
jgi:pSer/pThr/pTyr-binding forkhead associated (FHA) protein